MLWIKLNIKKKSQHNSQITEKVQKVYNTFAYPDVDDSVKDAKPVLDSFFKKIEDLHIGEWDNHYEPIDYAVYNGFSWDLKIIFDSETADFISEGSNCYPFSYEELKNLIEFYATHETTDLNELNDFMFLS